MSEIGTQIKARRVELGISMRKLARAVNVSHETIRKIEAGETKSPGSILLSKIAKELDLNLPFLFYGSENEISLKAYGNTLEIVLPFELNLNNKKSQQLTKRLAVEFELLRESSNE